MQYSNDMQYLNMIRMYKRTRMEIHSLKRIIILVQLIHDDVTNTLLIFVIIFLIHFC